MFLSGWHASGLDKKENFKKHLKRATHVADNSSLILQKKCFVVDTAFPGVFEFQPNL